MRKWKYNKLSDDLRNNHKRLFVKAVCPPDQNVATTTELAPDAGRNYLRLRRQLETLEAQFLGLRARVQEIYKQ